MKDIDKFINICKMSQPELKKYLMNELEEAGYEVISQKGFLYARGDLPVLLTAHMDTVHKECVREVCIVGSTISSPQGIGGDDRCGCYIILEAIKKYKPYVLFCEDEEIGCVGSQIFSETEFIKELTQLNYIIELDRKESNDLVFYNCRNTEFKKYMVEKTGWKEARGSYTDISVLCPACDVAGVNLSCGYYSPHMVSEWVDFFDMKNTITVVENLLECCGDSKRFEYYYNCNDGFTEFDEDEDWLAWIDESDYLYGMTLQTELETENERLKSILYNALILLGEYVFGNDTESMTRELGTSMEELDSFGVIEEQE